MAGRVEAGDGEVEVWLKSGSQYWGRLEGGLPAGWGEEEEQAGPSRAGHWLAGRLHGRVLETIPELAGQCNLRREVEYRAGTRHGFYREWDAAGRLVAAGRFHSGKKVTRVVWCEVWCVQFACLVSKFYLKKTFLHAPVRIYWCVH